MDEHHTADDGSFWLDESISSFRDGFIFDRNSCLTANSVDLD